MIEKLSVIIEMTIDKHYTNFTSCTVLYLCTKLRKLSPRFVEQHRIWNILLYGIRSIFEIDIKIMNYKHKSKHIYNVEQDLLQMITFHFVDFKICHLKAVVGDGVAVLPVQVVCGSYVTDITI